MCSTSPAATIVYRLGRGDGQQSVLQDRLGHDDPHGIERPVSGATTISTGTLQVGTGLGGQDGNITGTQQVTDNAVFAYDIAGSVTYRALITAGSGSFVKLGGGALAVGNLLQSATVPVATVVNAGMLQITRSNVLFGPVPMTVNGGTLNLGGNNATLAGINGSGGMIYSGTSTAVLTLGPTTATNYFGTIGGITAVTLNSTTAVQTFSGVNTTTGPITVSARTLALGVDGTLGSNTIINPGGVLDITLLWQQRIQPQQRSACRRPYVSLFPTDINGTFNLLKAATISPAGTGIVGSTDRQRRHVAQRRLDRLRSGRPINLERRTRFRRHNTNYSFPPFR